jgi:hypothetical protein
MLKRLLAGLVIWPIVAVCFALSEPPVRASAPQTPRTMPPVRPESPIDQEMRMRQHHAAVNMILYTGRLGGTELATTERQHLDVIALK